MEIILKYFPNLSPEQIDRFERMYDLYKNWNDQINVISRKDFDQLYERHILHSLSIAKVVTFVPGTRILDVGCGGGFPGIPLAVLFPEVQFTLVDSIGKKIKVVNGVAEGLGLTNVRALQIRAEELDEKFDFVVSRAVTDFPTFIGWVWNKITPRGKCALPNGILYLKGGDLSAELVGPAKRSVIYDIRDNFDEEYFETKKVVYLMR